MQHTQTDNNSSQNLITPSLLMTSPLPQNSTTEFESPVKARFSRPLEDSQISTSSDSSNASSRNHSLSHRYDLKEEDTKYPVLLQVKTQKPKSLTQSLKETDILDTPVAEEGEEQEMENQFLKKLPIFADGQEFNSKKTHNNRFRENLFNTDLSRCRSMETSFLPLDSVEEDKNEEDINSFKQRRRFRLYSLKMEDLNEFNQNNQGSGTPKERRERRNLSMQMQAAAKEVIVEEQENKVLPHLYSMMSYSSASGSRRGSGLISSPGTRLRVDEIDFLEKEQNDEDSDENDVIDTIMEEVDEKNGQTEENKEYQVAKAKMNEEREFMKKVIKGDIIDELDSVAVLSRRSTEREFSYHASHVAEEIIEEDNNENVAN